jgi:hypothetical protein
MQQSKKNIEIKTDQGLAVRSYHDEDTGLDVMSFRSTKGYTTTITMYSLISKFDYGWNGRLADHVDSVFDTYNNKLGGREAIVFAMLQDGYELHYELHIVSLSDNIRLFKITDADGQLVPLDTLKPEEVKIIAKQIESNAEYRAYIRTNILESE